MARKYLNDIGLPDDVIRGISADDARREKWRQQIEEYGFAEYETWDVGLMFYAWLYERLKMYLDVTIVDLDYHKFEFDGAEYTERELIEEMIEGCKSVLTNDYDYCANEEWCKKADKVLRIWATVAHAVWW